ncbi:hypothetical protein V5P93_006600 [Actinokineospora auranticolor]|uniref:hypothetical protein n=1 Tax=Actinokineospora auranticolor TaxID=155976 RepID=UPI0011B03F4D|nr:hypothetical protein [Actinokineospora auranticolor]
MLGEVEGPRPVPEDFEVVLRRSAGLEIADLGLREPEPSPQHALVQGFAEQVQVPGVGSVCLEYLADVLAFEGGPEFGSFEEIVA